MPEKKPTDEPKTALQSPAPKSDGPRSFTSVLMQIGDGDAHEQLSQDLQALVRVIVTRAKEQNKTVKGSLTFKVTIAGDPNSTLDMFYNIERKEPSPKRPRSTFWADKSGNVTEKNPRQVELPMGSLRDVSSKVATRDVQDEDETRDAE